MWKEITAIAAVVVVHLVEVPAEALAVVVEDVGEEIKFFYQKGLLH
jgi:hypothetical protein